MLLLLADGQLARFLAGYLYAELLRSSVSQDPYHKTFSTNGVSLPFLQSSWTQIN